MTAITPTPEYTLDLRPDNLGGGSQVASQIHGEGLTDVVALNYREEYSRGAEAAKTRLTPEFSEFRRFAPVGQSPDLFDANIVCGDCLDVMRTMPDESVDLIFADSPFNVGKDYGESKDRRRDYREWCANWIGEGFRLLKPTGSFYLMTITRHLEWEMPIMAKHGVFVNLISWRNVTGAGSPRCYRQEYQPIMLYGKTDQYKFHPYAEEEKPRFTRWGKHKTPPKNQRKDRWEDIKPVYAGSIRHREAIIKPGTNAKAHPTQMPLGLPRRAMLFSTGVGDVVLDPFNGSGTTGEAAKSLNRRYIGIELNSDFVQITEDRLNQTPGSQVITTVV